MSEIKINLEEIIYKHAVSQFVDEDDDNMVLLIRRDLKESYIEFGKQLLELAAENVNAYIGYSADDPIVMVDKQSILDTIKQVE